MAKKQYAPHEILSDHVNIRIHDDYTTAPTYGNEIQSIKMTNAHIVRNATVGGQSSIDLQFVDPDGNVYVVMTTAAIMESLTRVLVDS